MKNDLVSVVVPVYNVEKYLIRCVNSLINQTYKHIEILLIDDGSTDNSSNLCDECKKNDDRIKVIHKKNGGLSDARNKGIEIAKGKFICFVDSDDWLPSNSIEVLYNLLIETNSDISCGCIKEVYSENINNNIVTDKFVKYTKHDALKMLFLTNISNSASGKLYKKELFNDIRYPYGKLYEDLATTYKIFALSNNVSITGNCVYYYFQNINGIMHKTNFKKRESSIEFVEEAVNFTLVDFPDLVSSSSYRAFYECMAILNDLPYFYIDCKKINMIMIKYRKMLDINLLSKKQKILFYFSFFGHFGIKLSFKLKNILKKLKNYLNKNR